MFYTKACVCGLLAGLLLFTGACTPAAVSSIAPRNWKMSVVTSADSSWARGASLFADLVKKRSGGQMVITVHPDGELAGGNQVKELNMLQDGSIDFTYHSNLLYTNLDQSFAAVSMPFLFTDYLQVDSALSGSVGTQLLQKTEKYGIVGLAFGENGFRQLTNSQFAISTPGYLQGLKIRIPGVDLYKSIFKSMRAVPVTMNFGEVYQALDQGQIDGQENPIDVIVSSRLFEVQKYITIWNYSYDAIILGINKAAWDGLSGEAQKIVKEAALEASREQVRISRDSAETQLKLLREKGMAVNELTPDQIELFITATQPVYTEWEPEIGPLLKEFQAY